MVPPLLQLHPTETTCLRRLCPPAPNEPIDSPRKRASSQERRQGEAGAEDVTKAMTTIDVALRVIPVLLLGRSILAVVHQLPPSGHQNLPTSRPRTTTARWDRYRYRYRFDYCLDATTFFEANGSFRRLLCRR